MSTELASIRAEVKAWEHNFKQENGRDPTVDDIRKQPAVAQKYRLYKKLSKASAVPSSSTSRSNDPPSTPPRQISSGSKPSPKLLQSSRVAESTAPLAGFNPFSPQKNDKGKQKEAIPSSLFKPASNPFTSPSKSKVQASQRHQSPDQLPSIRSAKPSSPLLSINPPSAISRARKRLRGEPVSPSPKKEKRRRVLSPGNLHFPKVHPPNADALSDSDSEEDEGSVDGAGSSFVDDSPMKPAVNGKAFTLLFEETFRPTSSTDLFGGDALAMKPSRHKRVGTPLPSMDDDVFSPNPKTWKPVNQTTPKNPTFVKLQTSLETKARSKLVQMTLPFGSETSDRAGKHSPTQSRSSTKRVLSETISEPPINEPDRESPLDRPSLTSQLLPPSPNPNESYHGKSKPKDARTSKAISRKKPKVQRNEDDSVESDDDSSNSNDQQSVKLVYHSRGIRATLPTEDHSEIEDPILNYTKHVQPRGKGRAPASVKPRGIDGEENHQEEECESDGLDVEKTEGSLPHELHRVLVLESLKSRKNVNEEESVVKGLLSGRRLLRYDPNKGGEVWGAGEDERDELTGREDGVFNEGEDEWEGDPIPWEVGELSESHYHVEEV